MMGAGHVDQRFCGHYEGCPEGIKREMTRGGIVKQHLCPGREFQVSYPYDHRHRQPGEGRDDHRRISASRPGPAQLFAGLDEPVRVGPEMMG